MHGGYLYDYRKKVTPAPKTTKTETKPNPPPKQIPPSSKPNKRQDYEDALRKIIKDKGYDKNDKTWTGKAQCFGFASTVFLNVFGKLGISVGKAGTPRYTLTGTKGLSEVGKILPYGNNATSENVKSLISKSRPGDFMQMVWGKEYTTHSGIFVSSDKEGFSVLEANVGGYNKIRVSYYKYSYYATTISGHGAHPYTENGVKKWEHRDNGVIIYTTSGL